MGTSSLPERLFFGKNSPCVGIGYSVDREKLEVTWWNDSVCLGEHLIGKFLIISRHLGKSGLVLIELILCVHSGTSHELTQEPTNLMIKLPIFLPL